MKENNLLNQIQKKIFLSTIFDGLSEIFQGFLLFLLGISFIQNYFLILLFILGFSWSKISKWTKEKYIFPRMGYVELSDNHNSKLDLFRKLFASIMCVSVILFFFLVFQQDLSIPETYQYIPIIMGAGFLSKSLYYSIFSGKWTYLIFGLFGSLLSIIFIIIPFSDANYHVIYLAFTTASIILIYGIFKFTSFIHKNPLTNDGRWRNE